MTPKEIKTKIDDVVFGQEQSKQTICFAFYLHLVRNGYVKNEKQHELPKPNLILIGSAGSGKTLIMNSLCEQYDIPLVTIDAALVAEGKNLNEIITYYLRYLVMSIGEEKASKAVFYFEDFDKITANQMPNPAMSMELQSEFLLLLDQKERFVPIEEGKAPLLFKMENIMYVFSGRFNNIEHVIHYRKGANDPNSEIAKRRDQRLELIQRYKESQSAAANGDKKIEAIGFMQLSQNANTERGKSIEAEMQRLYTSLKEDELEDLVHAAYQKELVNEIEDANDDTVITEIDYKDLVTYGVLPELASKIGLIAPFTKLTKEQIVKIIQRPGKNIIDQYKAYFHIHDDELVIKEEVYELIAEEVIRRNIGTRSINAVIIKLIEEHLFNSPNETKDQFVIDAEYFKSKFG